MTDKEKIRAEIERRLEELNPKKGEWMGKPLRDVNPRTFPIESELEKLLSFIDSLPEESIWHSANERSLLEGGAIVTKTKNGVRIHNNVLSSELALHAEDKWCYLSDLIK